MKKTSLCCKLNESVRNRRIRALISIKEGDSLKHDFLGRLFSQTRIIALGFAIMILIGSALLMLPIASRSGEPAAFMTALFTATSASCVTGLVLADTYTCWTLFGQGVILVLIQIGGLGFMTIATFFSLLLRRRIGLREREIMTESINGGQIGGIVRRMKNILKRTAVIEGVGAILLAVRFIPEFGTWKGIYFSIFHAVSAFCNAGFDLMGEYGAYSSFVPFSNDAYTCLVLIALIVIGGIGFLVWDDVIEYRFKFRRYHFGTKIVLITTAVLILVPTVMFLILEWNNTLEGMPVWQKIVNALFDAVTPRTAGFNTTDTGMLADASKLLTIMLMFVGGSPGSTAGGIKTTTLVVIAVSTISGVMRKQSAGFLGRRFEKDALQRAAAVLFTNMSLALTGAFLISAVQDLPFLDILFEVFSAISTVGMTTGITRELSAFSCLVIIFLMYCGRVGSVSFATALLEKKSRPKVVYPEENIMIG